MNRQTTENRYNTVLRKLRGRVFLSLAGLWMERIAVRFWQPATLVLAFYTFAAFDGFALLPPLTGRILVVLIAIGGILLAVRGVRGFPVPDRQQAIARLDLGQDTRPLAALADRPAGHTDDPLVAALWARHQKGMEAAALQATPPPPDLRLARRDPYGLRLMVLVLALSALFFAPRDLSEAFRHLNSTPSAGSTETAGFEAWVNPPEYTGKPSIYLPDAPTGEAIPVPQGSEVVLRVYGLGDGFRLTETLSGADTALNTESAGLRGATFRVTRSGELELENGRETLGKWRFTMLPDAPPAVTITTEPFADSSGVMQLEFAATDDYGVTSGTATISLDLDAVERRYGLAPDPVPRPPLMLDLPMPFVGSTQDFAQTLSEDLAKHPWSGLPVTLTLTVEDGAGQQSGPAVTPTLLPGKRFYNPLAAAIAEQRRDILWSPQNDARALRVLRAVTYLPEEYRLRASTYLILRAAIRRFDTLLRNGIDATGRAEIADRLWDLAVLLEDGNLSDVRDRLRRAQERLSRALEQGASEQELQQLLEELEQATNDYLDALAQEAQQQGESQQSNENPMLDDNAIQQMLDDLRQFSENGQRAEAQAMLDRLSDLLENLQVMQGENPSAETMQQMLDALRQQQGLSDETFRQLQDSLNNGGDGTGDLADRQEALRDLLRELQQQPGGDRDPLAEAERNMDDAGEALREGDPRGALDDQARALENLREGIRQLDQEMREATDGQQGIQTGESQNDSRTDPLGRSLGETGTSETSDQIVPDPDLQGRVQELLDEIRRRTGERTRPEAELDYLKRLLDRF